MSGAGASLARSAVSIAAGARVDLSLSHGVKGVTSDMSLFRGGPSVGVMRQEHAVIQGSKRPSSFQRNLDRRAEETGNPHDYGSHVTPVVPPADPTDPQCSIGPLSAPPAWAFDESEPAPLTVRSLTGREAPPTSFTGVAELSAGARSDGARDTLPSPPPSED